MGAPPPTLPWTCLSLFWLQTTPVVVACVAQGIGVAVGLAVGVVDAELVVPLAAQPTSVAVSAPSSVVMEIRPLRFAMIALLSLRQAVRTISAEDEGAVCL